MIKRGDIVRLSEGALDFHGTARTAESGRKSERVRVQWHPEYGTWEDPKDLTVVSYLSRPAQPEQKEGEEA